MYIIILKEKNQKNLENHTTMFILMGKNHIYTAYLFENFEKNVLEVKTLKDIIYGVLMEH